MSLMVPRFKKGDICKVVRTDTVVIDDTPITLWGDDVGITVEIDEVVCHKDDLIIYTCIDRARHMRRYIPDHLMELK